MRRIVARAAMLSLMCSALVSCAALHRAEDPYVAAFRAIRPSVALLTVDGASDDTTEYGTASVLKSDAHGTLLLTDEHVVVHAGAVHVQIGAHEYGVGKVIARDKPHDAALVKIAAKNLPAVVLGDSSLLEAGDQVGVAGYPIPDAFAEQHLGVAVSLYAGRVASIRPSVLELDVPVIPGDSGGPVFDPENGRVIALSEARFDDERAIGFATPINLIKPFLKRYL